MNTTPPFKTDDVVYRTAYLKYGMVGQILKQEDAPLEIIWDEDGTSDWFQLDGRMFPEDPEPAIRFFYRAAPTKEKCYIAGKITGLPEAEYRANFEIAKKILVEMGYEPISPLDLPHNHGHSWAEYLREDIAALVECQKLFAMMDWPDSRGATIEVGLATALGLAMIYQMKDGSILTEVSL